MQIAKEFYQPMDNGEGQVCEDLELAILKRCQAAKFESLEMIAAGVAHDFNNILSGILGTAGLILMNLPPNHHLRPSIQQILNNSMRAREVTARLLSFAGQADLTFCDTNINDLVLRVMSSLGFKNIFADLDLKMPTTRADSTTLLALIEVLVENALEAQSDVQKRVELRTGVKYVSLESLESMYLGETIESGHFVYLEILDRGVGMDNDTLLKMFDPFFSTKQFGRGFGLSTALGIVKSHSGALQVESYPGEGTRLTVYLPTETVAEVESPELMKACPKDCSVALIIDDEWAVRAVVSQMLEMSGFEVLIAENGTQGISMFEDNMDKVDLVILDMTMPDINGEEVLRKIKQLSRETCVLMASGFFENGSEEKLSALGCSGFLKKPFAPEVLFESIDKLRKLS
jgi:CheY-like chemotaxis protein